jgi:hypothetical protein
MMRMNNGHMCTTNTRMRGKRTCLSLPSRLESVDDGKMAQSLNPHWTLYRRRVSITDRGLVPALARWTAMGKREVGRRRDEAKSAGYLTVLIGVSQCEDVPTRGDILPGAE